MLDLKTFTLVHVAISFGAILSGVVVMSGIISGKRLDGWTALFLATTFATTATGFLFPFHGFTPAIGVGIVSLVVLSLAIWARYAGHLSGAWRLIYVLTAVLSLYLNVFVLIVQAFEKVPALRAAAPTQTEPPFLLAQLVTLILFVFLAIIGAVKFRPERASAVARVGTA